jgi:hypothetical protein
VRDSGFPRADAEADFLAARRKQVIAQMASRLRGGDGRGSLSFDEVVGALGRREEQAMGVQVVQVKDIVGSVDKVRDFDPRFRPTSGRSRERWERLAEAVRRGESFPPIDVYQVGDMYFVRDGHHRVSVFRALGFGTIEADVTRVRTLLTPDRIESRDDLSRKEFRRLMIERVPLSKPARARIRLTRGEDYPRLAEMVEAWTARRAWAHDEHLDRAAAVQRWYDEEYLPVSELIDDAGLRRPDETEADAYMRVACDRYYLAREHVWNAEVMERLRREKPSSSRRRH